MHCKYCFYADEINHRAEGICGAMRLETAEALIIRAMDYAEGECTYTFQGGEPTLRGLDYFRQFAELADRYDRGRAKISYAIQTNGLLIDDAWASFFHERGFLVGLSLDGPAEIHDLNRMDNEGRGTFARVLKAADILKKHAVPFNVLSVITSRSARSAESIYKFFMKNGFLYQQYIPCLDPIYTQRGKNSYSLTPEMFSTFLIRLFDLWYEDRMQKKFLYLHYFECLAGMLLGRPPASCGMSGICSSQHVIEADGSVYPCDFYALDSQKLGNIEDDDFERLRKKGEPFIRRSFEGLEECQSCEFGFICRGGCRRDRQGPENLGKNYFCESYKHFFAHALPGLKILLRNSKRI